MDKIQNWVWAKIESKYIFIYIQLIYKLYDTYSRP